jgi:hypothetical protein
VALVLADWRHPTPRIDCCNWSEKNEYFLHYWRDSRCNRCGGLSRSAHLICFGMTTAPMISSSSRDSHRTAVAHRRNRATTGHAARLARRRGTGRAGAPGYPVCQRRLALVFRDQKAWDKEQLWFTLYFDHVDPALGRQLVCRKPLRFRCLYAVGRCADAKGLYSSI